MSRQTFFLALVFLALVESGLLIKGFRHRDDPDPNGEAVSPKQLGVPDRALPETTAPPTLHAEPDEGFAWLYTLVNGAKTNIDLTMYKLVDTTFSADLVQACQRGVAVRVILDQNREKAANTPAYDQLAAAGPRCTVSWANPQFPATHQKSMLVDHKTLVVMSFNTTSRNYAGTRDFALVDTNSTDVSNVQRTFNEDFGSTTDRSYQPQVARNLIWSPTVAQDDLVSLITNARATLQVENEELSAAVIVQALTAACRRGVKVSLTMTDTSTGYHANFQTLQKAGCQVHVGANNGDTLYIHAKVLVADLNTPNAIGYVGSINFSDTSMTQNRELGLYVRDAPTLQKLSASVGADFNSLPVFNPAIRLPNTEAVRP